jgi:two-component system OmpR family sensor kinase
LRFETQPRSVIRELKRRLIALLGITWVIASGIAIAFVTHETNEMFDNAMLEVASVIKDFQVDHPLDAANLSRLERLALAGDRRHYMTFQIRSTSGVVLLQSSRPPRDRYPISAELGFASAGSTRFLTKPLAADSLVQVGEYFDERRDAFLGMLAGFFVPLLALLGLSAWLVSKTIGRVNEPIAELNAQLKARSGANLDRIAIDSAPSEFQPIVSEVNSLLERLVNALQVEREFSANCAHELRNPIASAITQIDYLRKFPQESDSESRLRTVETSLGSLGRRIERLLQLSRAEAGVGYAGETADAVAVARLLVREYEHRGAAVKLETAIDSHMVEMDQDAVGIALQNLIDNALAHVDEGAAVDVAIDAFGTIRVVNDCAPIASADLAKLRARFHRQKEARRGGYGIGLAIVAELVRQGRGRLELASPAAGRERGFEAILELPGAGPKNYS